MLYYLNFTAILKSKSTQVHRKYDITTPINTIWNTLNFLKAVESYSKCIPVTGGARGLYPCNSIEVTSVKQMLTQLTHLLDTMNLELNNLSKSGNRQMPIYINLYLWFPFKCPKL